MFLGRKKNDMRISQQAMYWKPVGLVLAGPMQFTKVLLSALVRSYEFADWHAVCGFERCLGKCLSWYRLSTLDGACDTQLHGQRPNGRASYQAA